MNKRLDSDIDVRGIDLADLLMHMYNNTISYGAALPQNLVSMTRSIADKVIDEEFEIHPGKLNLDYVHGRPVKMFVEDGWLENPRAYELRAPPGAPKVSELVELLRKKGPSA